VAEAKGDSLAASNAEGEQVGGGEGVSQCVACLEGHPAHLLSTLVAARDYHQVPSLPSASISDVAALLGAHRCSTSCSGGDIDAEAVAADTAAGETSEDDAVRKIQDTLSRQPFFSRTVLVGTTDLGESRTEALISEAGGDARVPLIFSNPRLFASSRTVASLTTSMDVVSRVPKRA
jgi:hypothetical protein